jgi:hypothetical protein
MKHPDSSAELAAGHLDPHTQFGGQMEAIKDHWIESEDVRYVLFPGKQFFFLLCFGTNNHSCVFPSFTGSEGCVG